MTRSYLEHADALFGDPEVHQLLALSARRQVLDICTPREINVSRLLAWLLDPSEGHGLGDKALRSLLVYAGQTEEAAALSLPDRRFLAPHSVYSLALSSLVVETELNVSPAKVRSSSPASTRKRDLLDIAAIDPANKICVAVENKFGATEGPDQLVRYSKGLGALFPDYRRIHIFLDSQDASPAHNHWLPVGYGWLAQFLREQEHNVALSREVRRTLAEFREAVQDEDEESASASGKGKLITSVSAHHKDAIEAMWRVAKEQAPKKEVFLQRLKRLSLEATGAEGRAKLSLFQLYHRRPFLWDECKQQARFAAFYKELSTKFQDLDYDVKRVNAWYSLSTWERFVSSEYAEEYNFPAGVRVQALDGKFRITTYIDLQHVKQDKREAMHAYVTAIKKANKAKAPRKSGNRFDLYETTLGGDAAVAEVREQLAELRSGLGSVA